MQQIAQTLEQVSADLVGWLAVVAGLGVFALLLRIRETRLAARTAAATRTAAEPIQTAQQLGAARTWRLVTETAFKELARVGELAPMQARAVNQIDAAEHAFNRLTVELAKIGCHIASPTIEPMRQLASEPVAEPQRQQLAA